MDSEDHGCNTEFQNFSKQRYKEGAAVITLRAEESNNRYTCNFPITSVKYRRHKKCNT